MTADEHIAAYYNRGEEQSRLAGVSRLEFIRTQELLERRLPSPPAVVLDAGGGPGAYALWLAAKGYEVHLLDLIELHVDQARATAEAEQIALASAAVGDARDLALCLDRRRSPARLLRRPALRGDRRARPP